MFRIVVRYRWLQSLSVITLHAVMPGALRCHVSTTRVPVYFEERAINLPDAVKHEACFTIVLAKRCVRLDIAA